MSAIHPRHICDRFAPPRERSAALDLRNLLLADRLERAEKLRIDEAAQKLAERVEREAEEGR